jgi:hypothetical protein
MSSSKGPLAGTVIAVAMSIAMATQVVAALHATGGRFGAWRRPQWAVHG